MRALNSPSQGKDADAGTARYSRWGKVSSTFQHTSWEGKVHNDFMCLQDADGDGYLSFDELRQALERDSDGNDPGIARVADMAMKALDVSGDGFIEYHEFLAAAIDRQRILTDHTLAELFGESSGLFALGMLTTPIKQCSAHQIRVCDIYCHVLNGRPQTSILSQ